MLETFTKKIKSQFNTTGSKILLAILVIFFLISYLNKDSDNFIKNKLNYFSKFSFFNKENKINDKENKIENKIEGKTIDGVKLPPDPGAEGKKTLVGIDSDKDGIRDDVQIAIYERYPTNPEFRKILFQVAKDMQDAVIAGAEGDRNKILKLMEESGKGISCLSDKIEDGYYDLKFLGIRVRDTRERILANEKFDVALNGTFWGTVDCEE
ncbi:MAG: hypothetical protein AAB693_01870 [Patescibacteria group bacterium]